jgi:CheY-like chemotaxis protein
MSPEVQRRIFEPFFSTKFQGRGMGLAAVYGIVDNHAGHIVVQSEEGQGATFEIYLPTIEEPVPSEGQESGEKYTDAHATGTATVLIVQDSEPVQKLTERMVERMGCHVLVARSRQQALEVAQDYEGTIDLALIDVEGSSLNAPDVYARLSNAQPGIKFILSGSDELDAQVQALLVAGIGTFVQKPFQVGELEAAVRGALGEEQTKTPLIH